MKRATWRGSNQVRSTEAYYEITDDEVQDDNSSKNRKEKKKKKSTWPKGSWALRRGEVEALRTEEGEVVGGAGGCWEEKRREEKGGNKAGKCFKEHACRAGAREAEVNRRACAWSCLACLLKTGLCFSILIILVSICCCFCCRLKTTKMCSTTSCRLHTGSLWELSVYALM